MSQPMTQPGVEVPEQLWQEFRQDVERRRGTVHGNLSHELQTALREYLNASRGGDTHDRLRRIENLLEDIHDDTDADSASESDNETDSVSKTTENRISDIMSDINDRADELNTSRVPERDVEAAIERHAGVSHKTIQRYKELLQNQRHLYADPVNDVFYVDDLAFVARVENGVPREQAERVREAYGADWYDGLADQLRTDGGTRGFQ